MSGEVRSGPPSEVENDGRRGWYSTDVALPAIVGASLIAAGSIAAFSTDGPTLAREILFDGGVTLIVVGIVAYFLVGLWLVPTSVALGGVVFLVGDSIVVHLAAVAPVLGLGLTLLGILGAGWGVSRRAWPAPGPDADDRDP